MQNYNIQSKVSIIVDKLNDANEEIYHFVKDLEDFKEYEEISNFLLDVQKSIERIIDEIENKI